MVAVGTSEYDDHDGHIMLWTYLLFFSLSTGNVVAEYRVSDTCRRMPANGRLHHCYMGHWMLPFQARGEALRKSEARGEAGHPPAAKLGSHTERRLQGSPCVEARVFVQPQGVR